VRPLSFSQARRCEEAALPRCRCRRGGALHGARRGGQYPPRAFFERLPEADPHLVPEPRQGRLFGPAAKGGR